MISENSFIYKAYFIKEKNLECLKKKNQSFDE